MMYDKDVIMCLLKRPPDLEHDGIWYWWPELIRRGVYLAFSKMQYRFVKSHNKELLCVYTANGCGQSLPNAVQKAYATYLMECIIFKEEK